MQRVDVERNLEYLDDVKRWRFNELTRLFPEMPTEEVRELALRDGDPYLLETALRLARDKCPPALAYRILR